MKRQRLLSALIAIAIVLLSTVALVQQSRSLAPHNPLMRVLLSYLAVPGFAVGTIVGIIQSRFTHNISLWLAIIVSVPTNWLLYYGVFLGIFKLANAIKRQEERKKEV